MNESTRKALQLVKKESQWTLDLILYQEGQGKSDKQLIELMKKEICDLQFLVNVNWKLILNSVLQNGIKTL